ncbi:MAG: chemotaxis protein CheA, partial [Paenirhodobacter sp.]
MSYGTFSCTLEGFDEPFNTMKAIAEYFRDLAADDRYFGAEPPQPDAEMLHKIAEREIQRRVDAKIQKNGVILRPQELAAEEAPPEAADPAPAAEPVTETAVEAIAEPVAEAPAEIAAETAAPAPRTEVAPPAPVFAVPPSADPVSDSVAAKLQRIRAAVASARAAAEERAHPAAPEEAEEVEPAPFATALPEAAPAAEGKFSFDLDISGPLQSEEEEEAASEPAPSEPVAPEPEARAEAEDEAEEASAAAEDRAEEPEALSADAIAAEDEALDRLEARRRRRAE